MTDRTRIYRLIESAANWTLVNPAWINTTKEGQNHVIDKIERYAKDENEAQELFAMITGYPYNESEKQR